MSKGSGEAGPEGCQGMLRSTAQNWRISQEDLNLLDRTYKCSSSAGGVRLRPGCTSDDAGLRWQVSAEEGGTAVAVDRSLIGLESEPVVHEVERGAIRKFAEAVGDPNPVYQRGDIAPPTFPTTFQVSLPGLNFDLKRALHGGEEYTYLRPIRAGDRITVVRRVKDIYQREGSLGVMTFYILESEGTDSDGNLVYTGRSTIILR